jgi:hypothetical protein
MLTWKVEGVRGVYANLRTIDCEIIRQKKDNSNTFRMQ